MPFDLSLPQALRQMGYKVKVYDNERLEPPHVTILRREVKWRLDLRDMTFMNEEPDPRSIDDLVLEEIKMNLCKIRKDWDQRHKNNPVNVPCPNPGVCDVCTPT